ncbi:N-acetylmannosamine kinase [Streptomyces antimycoticus]
MGVETPGSQSSLHRANLERVVRAVRMAGSLTQAEIARSTGLSAATVSNIVRELKDGGTVEVTPTSAGGRRARSVSLSGDAGIVVGVDFGHTHLRVAIGNLAHQVLAEEAEPLDVDASASQGLDRAEQLVSRLITASGLSQDKVVGVGLGVPAPIDVETGTLGSTAILPGWAGTNPRDDLAQRLGVPVHVDNDANLGALGELVWGSGRGVADLAYIKVADGVGAGLVISGKIYRGPGGTAGEIGHITLDESGPVCRCGNRGCLETFTAARYVLPLLQSSHGADLTVERGQLAPARATPASRPSPESAPPTKASSSGSGKSVQVTRPHDAQGLGIATVYQDLALCDNIDVVGNLFLGREILRAGVLDEVEMERRSRELLQTLSIRIPSVRIPIASLSGGQRQTVAIARSMLGEPKLVILDEPTAALGVEQTAQVLDLVERLRDRGLAVILISHNMADVKAVADRVAVLRLGRNNGIFDVKTTSQEEIISAITGATDNAVTRAQGA